MAPCRPPATCRQGRLRERGGGQAEVHAGTPGGRQHACCAAQQHLRRRRAQGADSASAGPSARLHIRDGQVPRVMPPPVGVGRKHAADVRVFLRAACARHVARAVRPAQAVARRGHACGPLQPSGRPEWSKQLTGCSHWRATAVQHITHAGPGTAAAGANWSPTGRADRACRWRGGVQAGAASAAAAVPHEPALLVVPDVAAHLREAAALGPCWRPAARPLKAAAALSPPPAHGFPLLLQARRVGTVGKRRVLAAATSLLSTAQPTEQSLAASSTLTGKCIRLQVSRSAQPGCRRKRRPRRRARPG